MRIAFIVYQFPCLSETFILRQITGLLDRGHDVNIFASSPPPDGLMHDDVSKYDLLNRTSYFSAVPAHHKVFRLVERFVLFGRQLGRNPVPVLNSVNPVKFGKEAIMLRALYQIAPFLDKPPYDIVHCQFGPLGYTGLLLRDAAVFQGNVVTSFRGSDISSYISLRGRRVYDDLFARGDLFLCVSSFIKDKLVKLGCDERKIIVHKSGVDAGVYDTARPVAKSDGKIRIMTVARLVEKKGVEYGIRAIAQVLEKYPHVEYNIAGDGPLRSRLEPLIEELRVGSHVNLLGWKTQKEVNELLEQADILLAPSITTESGDAEGIPNSIMEAFTKARPVVSTAYVGVPELVQDGESGFLVPERDVDALAKRLEFLIERPELRVLMGKSGRRFVEEHHNIERLNDRLISLYQKLLRGELLDPPVKLAASEAALPHQV
jgi:colanic acid/amylovoran biosynthesis glycosyltransferase